MSEYDIGCWNCKEPVTLEDRRENDGDCPYCESELDLETYFLSVAAERDALKDELNNQVKVLSDIRSCLERANSNGLINDTIWFDREMPETLFDFIDIAIQALDNQRGAE